MSACSVIRYEQIRATKAHQRTLRNFGDEIVDDSDLPCR